MQTYCTCHKQVVMFACNSTIRTVLFSLIGVVFIQTAFVALDIESVAYHLDEGRDNHRLC